MKMNKQKAVNLLEAAKEISENCLNRQSVEDCDKCPFKHKGQLYLDNFCIVQEPVNRWAEYIEDMLLHEAPKE